MMRMREVLPVAVLVMGSPALAQSQLPDRPAASQAEASAPTRESIAQQFVLSYLNLWSAPNLASLRASRVFYRPRVSFHGRSLSAEELLTEKIRFVARWPERSYVARLDTMKTTCKADRCSVSMDFDFFATSGSRRKHSEGRGIFQVGLQFVDGRPFIVRENSRVTKRVLTGFPGSHPPAQFPG